MIKNKIMIKTFDEFTLNEGVSKSKMKAIDFEGDYAKLIKKCTSYIIEYIKLYGDIVFPEPQHLYFKSRHNISTKTVVSVRVDGKDGKFGRAYAYDDMDECLVATTEDGQEIPITSTTAPSDTYFILTDHIYLLLMK